MDTAEKKNELSESEIIARVRWRYRVCHYFFNLSGGWFLVGYAGLALSHAEDTKHLFTIITVTGFGIFSAAFALTLAIYRCPVCDKFIRRFRQSKEHCGACGVKIR